MVEVDGVPHRVSRDDGGVVRVPGPALVVAIPVSTGDMVEAGDVVAVVEAMKMESSLTAPFRGRIKRVFVGENVHVGAQAALVALEAIEQPAQPSPGERLSFASLTASGDTAADPAGRTCTGWSGWCSATTLVPWKWNVRSPTCMASAPTCSRATRR